MALAFGIPNTQKKKNLHHMLQILKHLAFIYSTVLIIEQYNKMVDVVKIVLLILINSSLSLSVLSLSLSLSLLMVVAVSFWVVLWFDFGGCGLILEVVFMMADGG